MKTFEFLETHHLAEHLLGRQLNEYGISIRGGDAFGTDPFFPRKEMKRFKDADAAREYQRLASEWLDKRQRYGDRLAGPKPNINSYLHPDEEMVTIKQTISTNPTMGGQSTTRVNQPDTEPATLTVDTGEEEIDVLDTNSDDSGSQTAVAKTAYDVKNGSRSGSTYLRYFSDGKLGSQQMQIVGFSSFPAVKSDIHQITTEVTNGVIQSLLSTLHTAPSSEIARRYTEKASGKGSRINISQLYSNSAEIIDCVRTHGKYRVVYHNLQSLKNAISRAESVVEGTLNVGIEWVTSIPTYGSFCLAFYAETEDINNPEAPKSWRVFGAASTDTVNVNVSSPSEVVDYFPVGSIETYSNFYAINSKSLERISALYPAKALEIPLTGGDLETVFGAPVAGKLLDASQVRETIERSYSSTPQKQEELLKIYDKVAGDEFTGNYPIKFTKLGIDKTGFSVNAIGNDFMEVLQPVVMMHPERIINNGIYDAASTFLGTTDLASCKIFYPGKKNAALFDSMLVSNDGKRLMLSTKARVGMAPSIPALGKAYVALKNDQENLPNEIRVKVAKLLKNEAYCQLLDFMSYLGKKDKSNMEQYLPTYPAMRELAQEMLSVYKAGGEEKRRLGEAVTGKINRLPGFKDFCTDILNSTNLVQVNTQVRYDSAQKIYGDVLVLDGFLATWPNNIWDEIKVVYNNGFRFSMDIGSKTWDSKLDPKHRYDNYKSLNDKGQEITKKRYTQYDTKLKNLDVTLPTPIVNKGLQRKPIRTLSWAKTIDMLNEIYDNFMEQYPNANLEDDKVKETFAKTNAGILYDTAFDTAIKNGFDPSGVGDSTVRRVLYNVGKLLEV